MEIIPVFGTSFTTYVPIVMTLVALVTLFDGFARVLKMMGVETEDSLTPTTGFCGFFKRRGGNVIGEDEMDTELLEKCKSGKMIIANELRQLAIAHEALRKNRGAVEIRREQSQAEVDHSNISAKMKTGSVGATNTEGSHNSKNNSIGSSGGFLSNWKDTVTSKVGLGGAKYSNLEVTRPRSMLEDEDEDEENIYFDGNNSRHSKSSFVQREDDMGESIYTSTLSANLGKSPVPSSGSVAANSGLFNSTKSTGRSSFTPSKTDAGSSNNAPGVTRGLSFLNPSKSSTATASTTSGLSKDKSVATNSKPKNFFDFDDDDNNNTVRGRYSDV